MRNHSLFIYFIFYPVQASVGLWDLDHPSLPICASQDHETTQAPRWTCLQVCRPLLPRILATRTVRPRPMPSRTQRAPRAAPVRTCTRGRSPLRTLRGQLWSSLKNTTSCSKEIRTHLHLWTNRITQSKSIIRSWFSFSVFLFLLKNVNKVFKESLMDVWDQSVESVATFLNSLLCNNTSVVLNLKKIYKVNDFYFSF